MERSDEARDDPQAGAQDVAQRQQAGGEGEGEDPQRDALQLSATTAARDNPITEKQESETMKRETIRKQVLKTLRSGSKPAAKAKTKTRSVTLYS